MPLESLLELVKTLSDRIDKHGAALRQSEALTRYTLIDPLLHELGWDTANPDMVIPEYRVPNNQIADYVLQDNGHPVMVVESKKLDEPLQSGKALDQGILYCAHTGSKHFVLTDGRLWEIYEASNTTPLIRFDVKDDPAQACLNALALWQPSVMAGQVSVGRTPVVKPTEESQVQQSQATYDAQPIVSSVPVLSHTNEEDWQPLSIFRPGKGSSPPTEILFPDNRRESIKNWAQIPVEVVRWLTNMNLLGAADCPITGNSPRSFRHMVHTRAVHSNGDQFTSPTEVNGLYVERHDNRVALRNKTVTIIEHVGQDPSQFKVRLP